MEKVDKIIVKLKSKSPDSMDDALLDLSDDDLVYTPFPKFNSIDNVSTKEEKNQLKTKTTKCWNNIKSFVIFVSVFNIMFVTLEMYLVAIITTIEKRFGFASSQSGFLLSIKEIAILLTAVVVTHAAKNTRRPRFIAAMGLIAALGGFVSMLPYVVYDRSTLEVKTQNTSDLGQDDALLCNTASVKNESSKQVHCTTDLEDTYNRGAYVFFSIGAAVLGLAASAHGSLTAAYIDDNSFSHQTSMYLGVVQGVRPLGPVFAFVLGGVFLSFYEDLTEPDFDKDDPRYIGAWWLGYVVLPIILLPCSAILFQFPARMPEIEKKSGKFVEFNPDTGKTESILKDFVKSIWRLVRNPEYVCLTIGGCFSAFVVSGMFPFIPKYIETAFRLDSSSSNYVLGFGGTLMAAFGMFLGGAITARFHLKLHQMAALVVASNAIFAMSLSAGNFVSCEQHDDLHVTSLVDKSNNTCNLHCDCDVNVYEPICGPDMITYVSPCHAGCMTLTENGTFTDCLCIPGDKSATTGACPEEYCAEIILYMVIQGIGSFLGFIAAVPGLTIVLKIVDGSDKALAMALGSTVCSLASFVPGPVIFGALIDSTCLLWQTSCGDRGACALYDNDDFRYKLHSGTALFKSISLIFYFATFVILWKKRHYYEEEVVVFDKKDKEEITIYNIHKP